ncbi:hypothetical protein A1O7_02321 [Cladophialophora yegresii CBS 114405]|uniref:Uncharacterized protein n=1 Tax=Cladophialophora yegresii CBS 114405 TaxID=1182544 RepID=W9WA79_9EURO|nr:uncharacterized protein A1O7_02321 [Cladophialophora yegresii CBS 114405]EXJ61890.1 hypothetical protein A1O7_02321 [Cladophialophora yegresii CBS 114405]
MAHKHNRRRVRPRNRNHSTLNPTFDIPDDLSTIYESSILPSASHSSSDLRPPLLPATLRNPDANVASRHWYNRYTAWQNREKAQRREAATIEAEQIKLFGGEPGDDMDLCYKMMEVFEGMNWIDTLE